MRRDQLEHAIRTACQITGQLEVIVVGSQAILGSFPEYELPALATMSMEVDILPITDDNDRTLELADLIAGVAGEFSSYDQVHGFSIDGVDSSTAVLPDGWRTRSSGCRTPIPQPPAVILGTPVGVSTKKICAWPSCARSEKRMSTSSTH